MTPELDTGTSRQKWPRAALQALLHYGGSALVLFLLFQFLPGWKVWHTLGTLPTHLWILVLAGYLATHCIGVTKWRLMVNLAGSGLNWMQAARCYFAGLFGSLFLPSLIGGDLVRAGMALRIGRTKAGVLLGSFVDRGVDLVALALLAGAGALLVPGALDQKDRRIFLLLGGIAALGIVVAVAVAVLLPVRRFSYRMKRRFVRLRRAARSMAHQPRAVVAALSFAVSAQLVFITLNIALAEACGLHLAFRVWLFAWPLAKLSAALPVTQGGIGVREAALAALLLPFGAPPTLSVAAGIAWEAIVIGGGLVAGLTSFLMSRFTPSVQP
ncbi:MAG: lysylphosphatidylglycerol synthase transmembrane domain-containing protein [Candidatus Acidiferrales bacterium]